MPRSRPASDLERYTLNKTGKVVSCSKAVINPIASRGLLRRRTPDMLATARLQYKALCATNSLLPQAVTTLGPD
jgi:hypothetical protein